MRSIQKLGIGTQMERRSVEVDEFFLAAGQCFMFLLWVESCMCDFIVLKKGGKELIKRYNAAYGKAPHPPEFAKERMTRKADNFGEIRDEFFELCPSRIKQADVRESIERAKIFRNAFSHAQVQPFRPYLLYNPSQSAWKSIKKYCYCGNCSKRHVDCGCPKDNFSPYLKLGWRHIETTYDDIRRIDRKCFYPTAVDIGVEYRGVAWPTGPEGFLVAENRMNMNI